MASGQTTLQSRSPDETSQLAERLGAVLRAGDALLLTGDIGAGKSHFARSLILSLLLEPEDVPSPTFTLVQTYDTVEGEIWHADLYRLSGPDQVIELGLVDAFDDAICLVEWPDRLAELTPETALSLAFETTGDQTRNITLSWNNSRWNEKMVAFK